MTIYYESGHSFCPWDTAELVLVPLSCRQALVRVVLFISWSVVLTKEQILLICYNMLSVISFAGIMFIPFIDQYFGGYFINIIHRLTLE